MSRIIIPINEQALVDLAEDDRTPYAPEGSFTRWYMDALEEVRQSKLEKNETAQ